MATARGTGAKGAHADLVPVLRALVQLSAADLLYADEYLHRAETLLPRLCTREQYLAQQRLEESLQRLQRQLRAAAEREDWEQVRTLAEQAAQGRERLAGDVQVLKIAEAVYGPRTLRPDPAALAFAGIVVSSPTELQKARAATLDQLRLLVEHDAERAAFYRNRLAQLERLQIASEKPATQSVDMAQLRRQIIQAVEKGDFAQVRQLTHAALNGNGRHGHGHDRHDVHVLPGAGGGQWELTAALPASVVQLAAELGLTEVMLAADDRLRRYMNGDEADTIWSPPFVTESHADRAVEPAPSGILELRSSLRENLELLLRHPFVSSAGTRYLPRFGAENLLVEVFAGEDPRVDTGLLKALGLSCRLGLSRLAIEHAIRTHGASVCSQLGLDPAEFTVACIPFDVFVRLAPQYGWGREQLWTHFDGYQVTPELRLRALVGGDARYGGPDDLCSVERDYDTGRLTARFAILRRQRFLSV